MPTRLTRCAILLLCFIIFIKCATDTPNTEPDSLDERQAIENLILSTRQKLLTQLPDECQALFFKAEMSMHQIDLMQRSNHLTPEMAQQYSQQLTDQLQGDKNCDPEVVQKLFKKSVLLEDHILTLKLLVKQLGLARVSQHYSAVAQANGAAIDLITSDTLREPVAVLKPAVVEQPVEPAAAGAVPVAQPDHVATVVRQPVAPASALNPVSFNYFLAVGWIVAIVLIVGSMYVIVGSQEYIALTSTFPPAVVIGLNHFVFFLAIIIGKLVPEDIGVYFALLGCLGMGQASVFSRRNEVIEKKDIKAKKDGETEEIVIENKRAAKPKEKPSPGEKDMLAWKWSSIGETTEALIMDKKFITTINTIWLINTLWYQNRMIGYINVGAVIMSIAQGMRTTNKKWTVMEVLVASAGIVTLAYTVLASMSHATGVARLINFFALFEYGVVYLAWPLVIFGLLWVSTHKKGESPRFVLNVIYLVTYLLGFILSSYMPPIHQMKNVCGLTAFAYLWTKYLQFMTQSGRWSKPFILLGFGVVMFFSMLAWHTWPNFFFRFPVATPAAHVPVIPPTIPVN